MRLVKPLVKFGATRGRCDHDADENRFHSPECLKVPTADPHSGDSPCRCGAAAATSVGSNPIGPRPASAGQTAINVAQEKQLLSQGDLVVMSAGTLQGNDQRI